VTVGTKGMQPLRATREQLHGETTPGVVPFDAARFRADCLTRNPAPGDALRQFYRIPE
jgi:hypothetical protein